MPAYLAAEFASLGAQVGAICPAASPISMVKNVSNVFRYSALTPTRSVAAALRAMRPDIVIPCDDRTLKHLHEIHASLPAGDALRQSIERSLGDPARYAAARSRGETLDLAAQEGIPEPATRVLHTEADVRAWCAERALPAVLKMEGSWGGNGVAAVDSPESAVAAFRRMTRPMTTARVLQYLLSYRDPFPLHGWLHRERSTVVGQDLILGRDANIMVACWQGEVLATVGAVVVETTQEFGPATIVQPISHPGMEAAAARLVRRLGMSGFCGLDFVLETGTDKAYLIELNPRATQLGHLPLTRSGTLASVLLARLRGEPLPAVARVQMTQETVAFFPQAWMSGATSSCLRLAYQDIPWDEPELMTHLLRRLGDRRGLVTRAVDRLMGRRGPARLLAAFRPLTNAFGPDGGNSGT
jgi:hypothetical protein